MRRTGVTDLPLHGGRAPRWLFKRMVRLARALSLVLIEEFGPEELLRRLADPFWFQAFGCLLGFDWHSSGLTTTVGGALKEALSPLALEIGIFVCGGKARASRRTPEEILFWAEKAALPDSFARLVRISRLTAKVDNTALQDGFNLYHHLFLFTRSGAWAVVQQGMNEKSSYARRYHWLSEQIESLVEEPHSGILSAIKASEVLNLVAKESHKARVSITELATLSPKEVLKEIKRAHLVLPRRHSLSEIDLHPKGLEKVLLRTYEKAPQDFETLLEVQGLGPKSLRALALVAELLYDVPVSRRDPARYAFAHGGKDGHPFPVDRRVYDQSISYLEEVLARARLGALDKGKAFRRLRQLRFFPSRAR